jgi:hypothetical protein
MFNRTRLISIAAISALIVSVAASALAATHPKKAPKKVTHASKLIPKSTSPAVAPTQQRPPAGGRDPGGRSNL